MWGNMHKRREAKKRSTSKLRLLGVVGHTVSKSDETVVADPKTQKHLLTFDAYLKTACDEFIVRWTKPDLVCNDEITNYDLVKSLGVGGFGRVMLASKRGGKNDEFFAIKMMDKHNIIKCKQIDHTIQELRVLDAVRFPFLVNLISYFKDNCYIFCVMPFIAGGELFYLLSKKGHFEETQAKFYASQVILAFEYLHKNGVIYRDLKPENILITVTGYLKITDFGFCKKIDEKRTWTLCGTPEYLAPEIILSQGYNYSVDWWTLGILIFEMVAGHPPFHASEPMKLYALIVHGKYRMPEKFSRSLQHLIQNLVQTDRDKRFGLLKNGVKDIKVHDWFKELDWNVIFSQTLRAPYVPKISASTMEFPNFEQMKEIELRHNDAEEYPNEFHVIAVRHKDRF